MAISAGCVITMPAHALFRWYARKKGRYGYKPSSNHDGLFAAARQSNSHIPGYAVLSVNAGRE
jgi:hypothetical protein